MTDPREFGKAMNLRAGAAFDALGRVTKTWVKGKTTESLGDTESEPTVTFEYGFATESQPAWFRQRARETHQDTETRWLESRTFFDGFGRVLVTKQKVEAVDDQAWVSSGRTVYNHKGNPIRQFEPFFVDDDSYEGVPPEVGVSAFLHYDPVGRVTRIDLPDGHHTQVELGPWAVRRFDQNDTDPASLHVDTPSTTVLDVLGRPVIAQEFLTATGTALATTTELDLEGRPMSVTDARGVVCATYAYDLLDRPLKTTSPDAGDRWALDDVMGRPMYRWNARGFRTKYAYDALRRPTQVLSHDGTTERLAEKLTYGEDTAAPNANLRGMLWKHWDEGGVSEVAARDFKGNVTVAKRTLLDGDDAPDWSGTPALEATTHTTETTFDALNRPTVLTLPDDSEERRVYDDGGRVTQVFVTPSWETTEQTVVDVITYDAKGQRTKIRYGNDVVTFYTYEPETFRLATLVTKRTESSSTKLQDLSYSYDPVGNIVAVTDACKPTITRGGVEVTGGCEYEYDALYRLVVASGREHDTTAAPSETAPGWQSFPANPNDPLTLHNFEETYDYDAVGNLEEVAHTNFGSFPGVAAGWTRTYETEVVPNTETPQSNRLVSTTVDSTTSEYTHDAHGNLTSMPHLSAMAWSANDRLESTTRVGNGHVMTCLYDGAGQRLRKRHDDGTDVATTTYLGALELYASTDDTEVTTLHVMDGTRRVLILEREGTTTRTRYQLGDHLGSACLEVDENGDVISMEEYHPYGSTALRYKSSAISQKKYRYTGKECDDETGFTYHDARYYAPWLGRWTAADPAGFVDGTNLYAYCRGNPVTLHDPSGMAPPDDGDQRVPLSNLLQTYKEVIQRGNGPTKPQATEADSIVNEIRGDRARVFAKLKMENKRVWTEVAKDIGRGAVQLGVSIVLAEFMGIGMAKLVEKAGPRAIRFLEGLVTKTGKARARSHDAVDGISELVANGKLAPEALRELAPRFERAAELQADAVVRLREFRSVAERIGHAPTREKLQTQLEKTINAVGKVDDADLVGTLRDYKGLPVPKGQGKAFDHMGEFEDVGESMINLKKLTQKLEYRLPEKTEATLRDLRDTWQSIVGF